MIPPQLLRSVVSALSAKTRTGQNIVWKREKQDVEHYRMKTGQAQIHLRFLPSTTGPDAISLYVTNLADLQLGALSATEEDGHDFDLLAELLFEIQRFENDRNIQPTIQTILDLLPLDEKQQWSS